MADPLDNAVPLNDPLANAAPVGDPLASAQPLEQDNTVGQISKDVAGNIASFLATMPAMAGGELAALSNIMAQNIGMPQDETPQQVASRIYNAVQYHPKSGVGQTMQKIIDWPFEKLAQLGGIAGSAVEQATGSKLAGETTKAGIQSLPALIIGARGGKHAVEEGKITESGVTEHPGVPQGENLPADSTQVRQGQGEQTGGGGGPEQGGQVPEAAQGPTYQPTQIKLPEAPRATQEAYAGAVDAANQIKESDYPTPKFVDGSLEENLYQFRGLEDVRKLHAKIMEQNLKETDFTPKDYETVSHNWEDASVPLTEKQQFLKDHIVRPLAERMNGLKTDEEGQYTAKESTINPDGSVNLGYFPREVQRKPGYIESVRKNIERGFQGRGAGGVFTRTTPHAKTRQMFELVDENGNKKVAHFKKVTASRQGIVKVTTKEGTQLEVKKPNVRSYDVTSFTEGKPTSEGRFRVLNYGQLSRLAMRPYSAQIRRLNAQLATTKKNAVVRGGEIVPRDSKRIARLKDNITTLERQRDETLAPYLQHDPNETVLIPSQKAGVRNILERPRYTMAPTTMRRVEANTNVRYYKNPVINMLSALHQKERATVVKQFMDSLKNHPEFENIATRDAVKADNNGWKMTKFTPFQGWYFEPHSARILDQMAKNMSYDEGLTAVAKMNHVVQQVMFFPPKVGALWHEFNMGVGAIIARGLTPWMNPKAYPMLFRTMGKAHRDVVGLQPDYLRMVAKGVPFQSSRTIARKSYQDLMKQIGTQIGEDGALKKFAAEKLDATPEWVQNVAERITPERANEDMWKMGDILLYRQILENKELGMPEDVAIEHAVRYMYTYRIPLDAIIRNSTMGNPVVSWFGRYSHDLFRIVGNMGKFMVKKGVPMNERLAAMDKLLALSVMSFAVFPAIDAAIKKLFGADRTVAFFGPTAIMKTGQKVGEAFKNDDPTKAVSEVLRRLLYLNPITLGAASMVENRNLSTGQKMQGLSDYLKMIEGSLLPVRDLMEGGPKGWIESQLGMVPDYSAAKSGRSSRRSRSARRTRRTRR